MSDIADPAAVTPASTITTGDTAWVLMSTALVMLMVPGLGYFYSGLARHKNALSLIFMSMLSLAVVSLQWWVWGYSLAFATDGGRFIGTLSNAFFIDMFSNAKTAVYTDGALIPAVAFMVYQGMFAVITPALAFGAVAERTRIIPALIFLFVWSTVVYDVIAYWTWAPNGWSKVMGSLDFAGGSPVHISSGAAGLAYAIVAGKRHGYGKEEFKPHNLSSVFLGTALLWFGWFGFNGGSALGANAGAVVAILNTNLSACMGGLTWVMLDFRLEKKFSAFGFCSGAVAGLVAITPGCGFVQPWSAVLIGMLGACSCNLFLAFKASYGFDDALDVFGVHGVGGIVGNLATGIFASKSIAALSDTVTDGGWVDGHYMQILYQLAGTVAAVAWSFTVTLIIVKLMDMSPWFRLRLLVADEIIGVDMSELGAGAYDYIGAAVRGDGTPQHNVLSGHVDQAAARPISPGKKQTARAANDIEMDKLTAATSEPNINTPMLETA